MRRITVPLAILGSVLLIVSVFASTVLARPLAQDGGSGAAGALRSVDTLATVAALDSLATRQAIDAARNASEAQAKAAQAEAQAQAAKAAAARAAAQATYQAGQIQVQRASQQATVEAVFQLATLEAVATRQAIDSLATRQALDALATSEAQSAEATRQAIGAAQAAQATRDDLDAQATAAAYNIAIAERRGQARLGTGLLYAAGFMALAGCAFVAWNWAHKLAGAIGPQPQPATATASPASDTVVIDGDFVAPSSPFQLPSPHRRMAPKMHIVTDPEIITAFREYVRKNGIGVEDDE